MPQESPTAHYKKLGADIAWCGIRPTLSYDDWRRVDCPVCRRRGIDVHGSLPR